MSIDDDRIEKLKRKLYSRNEEPVLDVRSRIRPDDSSVQNAWGSEQLDIPEDMPYRNTTHPFIRKFLWIAGLFFLLSVTVASYIFFGGGNSVSANNVDIQVAGPSTVAGGQETDLSISIVNQNHTDLDLAQWEVDYPDGSYADADSTQTLTHTTETIGTIGSGSSVTRTAKLYLFGDKGSTKTVVFKLTYQVSGSNAIFTKEKDYDITIGSSPIILNVTAPTTVVSGENVTLQPTIASNSASLLHNVLVTVQYPYGFTYKSSTLTPVAGSANSVWNLGDLQSGDTKNFSIVGTIVAQDGEQRTFQFSAGTQSTDPSKVIDAVLGQANPVVTVSKPSIDANMTLNSTNTASVAVSAGQSVNGVLTFTNTLPDPLTNASVQIKVGGNALDPSSVQAGDGGFYQSGTGTISWDKNSDTALVSLAPGDTETVSFSFASVNPSTTAKNPEVDVTATISGTDTSSSGAVNTISTSLSGAAKVSANLALNSRTLQSGAFANTGHFPPKAGSPTTYTIDWSLSNMWNDLNGTTLTATLPAYVDWMSNVSPSTAPVTYDANTRTVTWTPDAVSGGAGFSLAPKEAAFQVRLNPSLSQVGTAPTLTSAIYVSANDRFSGQTISFTSPALTTRTADTGNSGAVTN